MCIIDCLSTIVFILPLHLDYTKVIILILWWRNFQLEYWRTFQLVSTTLVTKVVFASKLNDFIKSNTIYNIIRYIDLEGKTLTVPDNSVLNFIGGTIGNGTIIGNKTKVINLNVDRIVLSGTWFDSGITSNRPTNVLVGFQYFDSTLSKPIYYKGNNEWVDATGATV